MLSAFYHASSYVSAVLAVVNLSVCLFVCSSVRPSVCPYVTRVLCDKTKQCTADILIRRERAITLECACDLKGTGHFEAKI